MPAVAPKKKASSSSSPSKSSSKSTARKPTAKSSHKTSDEKRSAFGEAVDELRDKRADFDQPIVDTPIAVVGDGEVVTLEDDKIELVAQGASIEVSLGGKKVTLDREGVHTLQNQLRQVSVGM